MLFLLATLATASAATHSVVRIPEPAAVSDRCAAPGITYAKNRSVTNGLRRLGEDPPASQYLAVDRFMGGCPVPAVVRTGIGR
ncbi:MAG TPA: hypothetical protein VH331_10075 [Allosphingosinicella sp.]|jgi:hypothetical protein|nr:hypothetical protein [Allosphingosinicella sp.]